MALDFAKRHTAAGEPWLYYLAYGPPHVPEQCPQRFLDLFPPEKFELPPDVKASFTGDDEKQIRAAFQVYYALVTAVDVEIGRLLDGLKRIGADENTIILYTSDHGDYLGSHAKGTGSKKDLRGKAVPFANAFRIPLIVRWPAKIRPGQMCEALVSSADLAPTLLDLAGAPPIPGAQGTSMASWCLTGDGPRPEATGSAWASGGRPGTGVSCIRPRRSTSSTIIRLTRTKCPTCSPPPTTGPTGNACTNCWFARPSEWGSPGRGVAGRQQEMRQPDFECVCKILPCHLPMHPGQRGRSVRHTRPVVYDGRTTMIVKTPRSIVARGAMWSTLTLASIDRCDPTPSQQRNRSCETPSSSRPRK